MAIASDLDAPSHVTMQPPCREPVRRTAAGARKHRLLFLHYHRHGDLAARRELIESFLPLARSLARRYERQGEPSEDLFQIASLALIRAIDRFDPDRGVAFSSYAVPTILGELRRHFRDSGWALHVPRSTQERVLELTKAVQDLSTRLGTSPTPKQIAAEMNLPVEEVLETMVAAAAHDTVSLDAPAGSSEDDGGATIAEGIGEIDDGYELAEHRPSIARALAVLPQRERRILHLRFVEDRTQSEIAQQLGISQMHVSRLIRTSLDKLRNAVGEA